MYVWLQSGEPVLSAPSSSCGSPRSYPPAVAAAGWRHKERGQCLLAVRTSTDRSYLPSSRGACTFTHKRSFTVRRGRMCNPQLARRRRRQGDEGQSGQAMAPALPLPSQRFPSRWCPDAALGRRAPIEGHPAQPQSTAPLPRAQAWEGRAGGREEEKLGPPSRPPEGRGAGAARMHAGG